MYPLTGVDLTPFPPDNFVRPLWETEEKMHMKVYLSLKKKFDREFLASEFQKEDEEVKDTVLLWKQDISSASLSKSFLLTSLDCSVESCDSERDASLKQARQWLDHADAELLDQDGGILSTISAAGNGIESTSILLTFYQTVSKQFLSLLSKLQITQEKKERKNPQSKGVLERSTVHLPPPSPMWSALMSNSTLFVHVIVMRQQNNVENPENIEEAAMAMGRASRAHSLLVDQVDLVKYETPSHLSKPGRILYGDFVYLFKRYILQDSKSTTRPPWDMEYTKPEYYKAYQDAQRMKEESAGYPYWKPEVAIKYLIDTDEYPMDLAHVSGMDFVRVESSQSHPSGIAHLPALHVDEIGLTSEKYIPVNGTVSSLPLRITFDRSDMKDEHHVHATTATAGGISPARWRLLTHLSKSIESQKQLGFEQSDIDDLRRLIADTNVTLLAITMLASALHLLFEFLTFKNEVSFWRNNTDLTGLSVRSLFLDMIGQVIIVFFLIEKGSSLLMTVPSACGCLIALWKCRRAAGLAFVRLRPEDHAKPCSWWNRLPRLIGGVELRATRLEISQSVSEPTKKDSKKQVPSTGQDLQAHTIECDRIATRKLGSVLVPLVAAYTLYSFVNEEHSGWYSWLITSASTAVYALGFVLMTPQLFLNHKMKSVAHLPWRVLVYKSLNTFIDDLFSFIIRMPTMARISCFRDDIVFFIYLYQRWQFPVDKSRPVEGGGDGTENVTDTKKDQ
jgi:hypothetical protein